MSATNIHASLVAFGPFDRVHGILIRGPARSGKSSLACALLAAAPRLGGTALLVADDRVVLSRSGDGLSGAAPPSLSGLIEISGLGILAVPHAPDAAVDLVVDLTERAARLPEETHCTLLGVRVRRLEMPVRAAALAVDALTLLVAPGTRIHDLD